MNPYQSFAAAFARLVSEGKSLPLGGFPSRPRPGLPPDAPVALIFSPHPDDECIIGSLALRLLRETGMRVINVAVTLGSDRERQPMRLLELQHACDWLGFDLEETSPSGLDKIDPATRTGDPSHWVGAVKIIAAILHRHSPRVIFFPHEGDGHRAHIGTHFLVLDALKILPADFQCHLVETEFWGPMAAPNLLVESSVEDVADLVAALSFHIGEVRRNPYHLRLPAWMQDNVRRGAELIGGHGSVAPDFMFATLYRVRRWKNKRAEELFSGGRQLSVRDFPGGLFAWEMSLE
jgi:LmbE family N-acetylglucosaminyl deacetylase